MTFDRAFQTEDPPTHAEPARPRRWSGIELYDAEHITPPEGFLSETLFCRGDVPLIAGRRRTGKTYLTLFMGICFAGGTPLGYLLTRKARVLFVSQEMREPSIRRRYQKLVTRSEMAAISDNLTIVCREPDLKLDSQTGKTNLIRLIQETGPDVAFLDALGYIKGQARENNNDEMNEVLLNLLEIAELTNTCLPLVHHMGKPREDGFQSGRGASTIEDRCADVLYISRRGDLGEKRLVTFDATRDAEPQDPFTFELERDPESGQIELVIRKADAEADEYFEVRKMVEIVQKAGGELSLERVQAEMGWKTRASRAKYVKIAEALNLLTVHKVGRQKVARVVDNPAPDVPF